MKENLKVIALVVIAISVFTIALLDLLQLTMPREGGDTVGSGITNYKAVPAPKAPTGLKTFMKLKEMNFDFGNVKQGDKVTHDFKFINTGINPLIITEAHGSCGCTVPTYPQQPIAPGDSNVIKVEFNSTGKMGLQNKKVFITANTTPDVTELEISANVAEAKK